MIDDSIPKPLFQNYNSFLILSAPPRSGKSTWIMNCLCKHGKVYNRKFDKVYVVSPSLKTAKDNPFESLPPEQIENELTVDFLDRFVNEVSESGEKVLLLLDDVVNDIRKIKVLIKPLQRYCTIGDISQPMVVMRPMVLLVGLPPKVITVFP